MKMTLKFGLLGAPSKNAQIVDFDSHNPQATRDILGVWFENYIDNYPSFFMKWQETTDDTNWYQVQEVESPLFDAGHQYSRVKENTNLFLGTVCIHDVQETEYGWVYDISVVDGGEVYTLSEENVYRLLIDDVQPEDLM